MKPLHSKPLHLKLLHLKPLHLKPLHLKPLHLKPRPTPLVSPLPPCSFAVIQMQPKLPRALPPLDKRPSARTATPSTRYVHAEIIGMGDTASAPAVADGPPGHSNLAALLEVVNRTDESSQPP